MLDFARAFDDAEPTMSRDDATAVSALLSTFELGPVSRRGASGPRFTPARIARWGIPVGHSHVPPCGASGSRGRARAFSPRSAHLQVPHPNLIQVRDFGEDAEMVYVVTDLLRGMQPRGADGARPTAADRVTAFVGQVLDATEALHRRGGRICGLHPGIIRIIEDGERASVAISSAGVLQIQDVLATLSEEALRAQATDETECSTSRRNC